MEYTKIIKARKVLSYLMVIGSNEFNIYDKDENRVLSRKLLKDKRLTILEELDDVNILYRAGYTIFSYNSQDDILTFCLQFMITSYRLGLKNVLQTTGLWSDRTYKEVDGLTTKVFFDYLLPETGMCITSNIQTLDGIRYWGQKVREAFEKHKHLAYVDFNNAYLEKLENLKDYRRLVKEKKPWGYTKKFQARRFVISEKDLMLAKD